MVTGDCEHFRGTFRNDWRASTQRGPFVEGLPMNALIELSLQDLNQFSISL